MRIQSPSLIDKIAGYVLSFMLMYGLVFLVYNPPLLAVVVPLAVAISLGPMLAEWFSEQRQKYFGD